MSKPVALTIAGSDPSGGAGIQADLKTFHQFGVYGMSVITLLTVQNTVEVSSVDPLDPDYVTRQLDTVVGDIWPHAVKTGALGNAAVIEAVASWARRTGHRLVVDPVMISKHGAALLSDDAREALVKRLFPYARVVMPNLHEASVLAQMEISTPAHMSMAAQKIHRMGPDAVLIKGGHLPETSEAVDVLREKDDARGFKESGFTAPRLDSRHTHGAGCTYSAAVAAGLAKGLPLYAAVLEAKRFISDAIATAPGLGRGSGPLNHHAG